jgi:hypothetical protein
MLFKITTILVAIPLLSGCASTSSAQPAWQGYIDCAAAYRANSQITDPNRPATMVRDMADVAADYAKAAEAAYARETSVSADAAHNVVEVQVADRTATFASRTRPQIEHFIEGCPQPGD